jgi:hypothetical protein
VASEAERMQQDHFTGLPAGRRFIVDALGKGAAPVEGSAIPAPTA